MPYADYIYVIVLPRYEEEFGVPPIGSFHVKWCKSGHDPSQNLIKICKVVTIYKIW